MVRQSKINKRKKARGKLPEVKRNKKAERRMHERSKLEEKNKK